MLSALPVLCVLPPVHLLVWGGYPVLRVESLLLLILFLSAGLLLTLILFRHLRLLRLAALVVSVAAALMMDTQGFFISLFPTEQEVMDTLAPLISSLIIVAVPGLLLLGLKDNGLAILGGASMGILISTILVPQPTAPAFVIQGDLPVGNPNLPPVLHLILDEHAAIGQLPAAMRPEIDALLADFRVFPDAYSPFSYTPFAMMAAMNPHLASAEIAPRSQRNRWFIEPNRWFEYLRAQGYVISVHQPQLLEYCSGKGIVDRCYTYNPFSVNYLTNLESPVAIKLKLLADRLFPWFTALHDAPFFLFPVAANKAVDDLPLLWQTGARGRVFFLHLTTPHAPFVYDSNCRIRLETGSTNALPSLEGIINEYHEQVRCAWRRIESLFVLIKENNEWEDAIILLHGDHGLRYFTNGVPDPDVDHAVEMAVSELPTLLAVRRPSLAPGIQPGRIAIPRAVNALMGNCEDNADDGIGYTVPRSDIRNKLYTGVPIQLQLPPVGPSQVPICSPN